MISFTPFSTPAAIATRGKVTLIALLTALMLLMSFFLPATTPLYAQDSSDQATETMQEGARVATVVYVVQRGDTLSAIAARYQTTVAALLRLNPQIRNPNRLYVGQRIHVPAPPDQPGEQPGEQPGGFTITRIHLISPSDGGPLGCGDTVVPVTVEVPPTRGILRATLERLLSIKTQYYGESGLYNALYQSQLTIEDVRIDNRVATIRLAGQIVLGGVCDTPRVQAQLEQAALQFSTVDQVRIYINGTLLQGVLN